MRRLEKMALLGGFGLALYVGAGVLAPPVSVPETATAVRQPVPVIASTVLEPEVVEVVQPPLPPPQVDELADAISGLLGANGHTEFVDRTALGEQIPASVAAVLIDNEVVLRVADEGEVVP